tara:strand:+ start:643 stop:1101 length:459 start_codon:yes stop_codon:yes gene_type:complete
MAKVSRSALKAIVKECLVEILAEGLVGSASKSSLTESVKPKKNNDRGLMLERSLAQQRKKLDSIKVNQQREDAINNNPLIQNADPIMAEIFKDTAKNTLANMIEADRDPKMSQRMAQGDASTRQMASSEPTDLFEGADRWAALAFMDGKKQS